MNTKSSSALLLSLTLGACITTSTAHDYGAVHELVDARAHWKLPEQQPAPGESDTEASADVRRLIAAPLTEESAVHIALLHNSELRAELGDLGIARGELAQASVLPNPEFDVAMRVPVHSRAPLDWDLGVGVDLTSLILRGQRVGIGNAEVQAARYRAASAVLDLGFRVRREYYAVVASAQRLEVVRTALKSFAAAYESARTLQAAGNTTDLDVATEHAAYEAARVTEAEAEADWLDERERLNVLLGFHGRQTAWTIAARLPDAPARALDREQVEPRAIKSSLELAESRSTLEALGRRVGLAESGWLPALTLGAQAERLNGEWAVGPTLRGSLPFFNRQQGNVVSDRARFDQERDRYVAIAVEVRAAVRAARDRTSSARQRARHYREVLLPARQEVLSQTLLQYNAMQIGVFQLLQAQRDQLDAARMHIDTLREYWQTRAALELILAGRLPVTLADGRRASALPMRANAEGRSARE
jgi:outer membrane protein TolC